MFPDFFRRRLSRTVVLSHDLQQGRLAGAKSSVPERKAKLRFVRHWYHRRRQPYHICAQYLIKQIIVYVTVWNEIVLLTKSIQLFIDLKRIFF